jgi:hypothetical protein
MMELEKLKFLVNDAEQELSTLDDTIGEMKNSLDEALADLRKRGDLVSTVVRHQREISTELRPNPSMRRVRSLEALLRSLERRRALLSDELQRYLEAKRLHESPLAKFRPKPRSVASR